MRHLISLDLFYGKKKMKVEGVLFFRARGDSFLSSGSRDVPCTASRAFTAANATAIEAREENDPWAMGADPCRPP